MSWKKYKNFDLLVRAGEISVSTSRSLIQTIWPYANSMGLTMLIYNQQ